jgi:hypothetical protein
VNLTHIMSIVTASRNKDWNYISCGSYAMRPSKRLRPEAHPEMAVFIQDVAISLGFGLPWMDDFQEPWVKKFPDRHASGSWADVFYNGALVFRTQYVTVDDGRTNLPLPPAIDKFDVPEDYVKFMRLIDNFGQMSSFDMDFRRAGMTVSDKAWPDFGRDPKKEDEAPRGLIH